MRLLFLTNLYPPYVRGGLENRCQETASRLQQRGQQVYILTSRYGLSRPWDDRDDISRTLHLQAGINYYRPLDFFARRRRQERENAQELEQILETFEPDLVVVWGMWNLSRWLPYWAEQWRPGRVAYVIASYWPLDQDAHVQYWELPANRWFSEQLKRPFRALALAQLRREGYPPQLQFEHAICCSHFVRDRLVEAGKLPAGAGVVPNGIDPAPFLRHSATHHNRPGKPLRSIYFGSVLPYKGVHTAIKALGWLKERGLAERVELTILGDGHPEYIARLEAQTAQLGLSQQVHFTGQVPRDEIPFWLEKHDLFLFTSTWPEPFGRTIIEAMAAGLVVIGSDVGGSREIFCHYSEELLFQAEDSRALAARIERVMNDPELRQRLAQKGQELVKRRFTLERMVTDMEQWFHEIAGIGK